MNLMASLSGAAAVWHAWAASSMETALPDFLKEGGEKNRFRPASGPHNGLMPAFR